MATDAISNDPIQAVPAELVPIVDYLVTEDDTPVDNVFSEKQMRLLTEPLYSSWANSPDPNSGGADRRFVAMANVGLFFDVHRPPLVPDVLLSMKVKLPADARAKRHRSYCIWEYGKPPDVVIEVVSNREGGEDAEKLELYAEIGVRDYAIYDPDNLLGSGLLRVYRLMEGEYCQMEEPIAFPKVGLGLRLWQGKYEGWENVWLRWVDAEGTLIPTGHEQRQRADRLAEQLRQLGVEQPKP
jgi:hypothetical protein